MIERFGKKTPLWSGGYKGGVLFTESPNRIDFIRTRVLPRRLEIRGQTGTQKGVFTPIHRRNSEGLLANVQADITGEREEARFSTFRGVGPISRHSKRVTALARIKTEELDSNYAW